MSANHLEQSYKEIQYLQDLSQKVSKASSVSVSTIAPIGKYLDPRQIPSLSYSPGHPSWDNVFKAGAALEVLERCADHYSKSPPLVSKVSSWLHEIWTWSEFILRHTMVEGPYTALLATDPQQDIIRALIALCGHPKLRDVLIRSTPIREAIIEYWLNEGDLYRADDLDCITRLMDKLLTPPERSGTDIKPILKAADERYDLVARAALRHFCRPYKGGLSGVKASYNHFSVLIYLSHNKRDPKVLDALLDAGAVWVILHFIDRSNCEPQLPEEGAMLLRRHNVVRCYEFLEETCLNGLTPTRWFSQMIKAGIIEILVDSPDLAAELGGDDPVDYNAKIGRMIELLGSFTVHYSAGRLLSKRLDRYDEPPAMKISSLQFRWESFLQIVEQRAEDRENFYLADLIVCSNRGCDKTEKYEIFRTCGGCRSPRYCSRDCQRADWADHKEECLEYQEALTDGTKAPKTPISPRDRSFIEFVSECEIDRQMDAVKAVIKKDHPRASVRDLFFKLNWTVVPPDLSIHRLKDILGAPKDFGSPSKPQMLAVLQGPWGRRTTVYQHYIDEPEEFFD